MAAFSSHHQLLASKQSSAKSSTRPLPTRQSSQRNCKVFLNGTSGAPVWGMRSALACRHVGLSHSPRSGGDGEIMPMPMAGVPEGRRVLG